MASTRTEPLNWRIIALLALVMFASSLYGYFTHDFRLCFIQGVLGLTTVGLAYASYRVERQSMAVFPPDKERRHR